MDRPDLTRMLYLMLLAPRGEFPCRLGVSLSSVRGPDLSGKKFKDLFGRLLIGGEECGKRWPTASILFPVAVRSFAISASFLHAGHSFDFPLLGRSFETTAETWFS